MQTACFAWTGLGARRSVGVYTARTGGALEWVREPELDKQATELGFAASMKFMTEVKR